MRRIRDNVDRSLTVRLGLFCATSSSEDPFALPVLKGSERILVTGELAECKRHLLPVVTTDLDKDGAEATEDASDLGL